VATAGVVVASVGVLLALGVAVGVGVTEADALADALSLGLTVWLGDAVADVDGVGGADGAFRVGVHVADVVGAPFWGVGPTPGSTAPCECVCVWADPPPTLADAPGPPALVDAPVELAGEMTWVTLMDM
jgi:hypothetical protein